MTDTPLPELKKLCITLYGTYAASSVMQFFGLTVLPGVAALMVAFFIGQSKKKAAAGTIYESHLRWLSRTFWIGSGVYVPIAIVISTILILTFTDIGTLANSMNNGDSDALMNGINDYLHSSMHKISFMTLGTSLPVAVWWLHRCWRGYVLAKLEKPVENVTTWF